MSWLKHYAGSVGVVGLLGALILWLFVDPSSLRGTASATGFLVARGVLVLGSAALLVSGLALNRRELLDVLRGRGTRYGAGAGVITLLALGIVVLANALSASHNVRWDFTENRRNTLSPQTIQVLRTLKAPIEAIAFFRTDTPGKRTAEDLLGQYASYSGGKFTWHLEDTDKAPGLAREYGVESYGTVVIKGGTGDQVRTEKVLDAEEEKLTNTLLKVTRAGKRVVYVLKGHGEREITNTDRPGLSQARDQMQKANYEVKELVLARDPSIPDEASVVIVAGPRTDLFPQETEALDAYIARGGKALFMASPFQAEGLRKYLEKYGIVLDDDVVIELSPMSQVFGTGPFVPIVSEYDQHPITKDLAGMMTLFPLTRSVEAAATPPKGTTIQPLAKTSARSWGETDKSVFSKFSKGEAIKPDPGEKIGPLAVALVATVDTGTKPEAKPAGVEPKQPVKARLVVVGTADFASNQFLGAQANKDFFLNIVSWLADEDDLLSVRPKDNKQNPIMLTSAQSRLVFWLPVAVLPGAVLLCGLMATARRRRAT
jgi:ABC-type uncharacterized transport system involved in gliding motility auxiliary subunit